MQSFVGHQRYCEAAAEAGLGTAIVAQKGLLDQVDASRLQSRNTAPRLRLAPCLVDVDPHAGAVAKRFLDGRHMRDVVVDGTQADF